ncbi:hypothetical protein KAW48_02020 [candidate division WOR-3 bacterium]|nr:hypothetical protein [candidate division WOR-3 bacterium]
MKRNIYLFVSLCCLVITLFGITVFAGETDSGLVNERMLHPLDSYTAYTFQKGEWAYNFPVLGLSPGWMWWGVTDWLTAEIDIECLLGGVPSFNFRFSLTEQNGILPALAYETMFQYLFEEIDLLEDYEYLRVVRKGASWYNRINASWRFSEQMCLHLSIGGTYSESILIENDNRPEYFGKHFQDLISPDLSLGIDWRISKWFSFHSAGSYGTTFIYLDNVPRKCQFTYGFRIAPLLKNRWAILRNLRLEFAAIFYYFPEARETVSLPVPILPYLYWQGGGN